METTDATVSLYNFLDWLYANRKKVLIGVIVVAVVALGVALTVWKKNQEQIDANNMLFSVPSLLSSGVRQPAPNPDAFLNITREYPSTSAGEEAELLAAEGLFLDGKYSDAEREFSKFAGDHPNSQLIAQALVGVAASLEAEGKLNDAMQKYRDIVVMYPTDPSIASPAKLTLARLNEEQNKPDQALSYYTDLARDNNPYDPWAAEARERRTLLLGKHPELDKPAAPLPGSASQQPTFGVPSQPTQPSRPPATTPVAPGKSSAAAPGSPALLSIPRQTTNGTAGPKH